MKLICTLDINEKTTFGVNARNKDPTFVPRCFIDLKDYLSFTPFLLSLSRLSRKRIIYSKYGSWAIVRHCGLSNPYCVAKETIVRQDKSIVWHRIYCAASGVRYEAHSIVEIWYAAQWNSIKYNWFDMWNNRVQSSNKRIGMPHNL